MAAYCAACGEAVGFHIDNRCNRPRTITEADEWLLASREAFRRCLTRGDLDGADRMYARLDWLLGQRSYLTAQVPA